MSIGYPTSKNRVSMGLSLTDEQMVRLDELAKAAGVKKAPLIAKLIEKEWIRQKLNRVPPALDEREAA